MCFGNIVITRVHCRHKKYTLYIGRPSSNRGHNQWQFGNPWVIGRHGTRDQVIEKYKKWLTTGETDGNIDATPERREWILNNLHLLDGQILGCFCNEDENCHGDVLIELFDDMMAEQFENERWEWILEAQEKCENSHEWQDLDPEDGCLDCGFGAK